MPIYSFECDSDTGGCGLIFDEKCSMDEIVSYRPQCHACHSNVNIIRNYQNISLFGPNITLGSLADKNTSKMGNDHKDHLWGKHNEYKFKKKKIEPRN